MQAVTATSGLHTLTRTAVAATLIAGLAGCGGGGGGGTAGLPDGGTGDQGGDSHISITGAEVRAESDQAGTGTVEVTAEGGMRAFDIAWQVDFSAPGSSYTAAVHLTRKEDLDDTARELFSQNCGGHSFYNCGDAGDFTCTYDKVAGELRCPVATSPTTNLPAEWYDTEVNVIVEACVFGGDLSKTCETAKLPVRFI
jgi:hypothetical protein